MPVLRPTQRFRIKFSPIQEPTIPFPRFPNNIASLTIEGLGELMSQYQVWREYTEDLLLDATATYTRMEAEHSFERKKYYLSTGKADGSKEDRYALCDVQPHIQELAAKLLESQLYQELLSAKLDSITNSLSVISREISRRDSR